MRTPKNGSSGSSAVTSRRIASAALIIGFFLLWEFLCRAFNISDLVVPKPSQILVGGRLFSATDDGVLSRVDTATGELVWQKRVGGNFSASLVATKDHFFAFDHDGKSYALTVADEPEVVSENVLPDGCRASPAIVDDSLLVRTTTHLYRFKKP